MMILVLLILSVAQLSSGQGGFPDGPGLGGFPNGPGQGGFPNGPGHGFPNGPVGGGVGAGGFGPNGGESFEAHERVTGRNNDLRWPADESSQCFYPPRRVWYQFIDPRGMKGLVSTGAASNLCDRSCKDRGIPY
ncbi:hypothetical protein RB195_016838 [Necator americanus]|uniref:Kunitz/Bovine pancreatic trypsin inhibitor domain protein n=1 Tax=Necator americanus TaxID=51031 RepID=A0ABR1C2E5_NECAM